MSWSRDSFQTPEESRIAAAFLADGYVILPAEDAKAVAAIQSQAAALAAEKLSLAPPADPQGFLDAIHDHVAPAELNALRLAVFSGLNAQPWLRPAYHAAARTALAAIVGNELAMQLRVNLSIQLPGDDSSLLPIHADVWNGDSPYEVVVWLPLVDCRASKTMFILPLAADARWQPRLAEFRSAEELYRAVEPELVWLEVPAGHLVVFSQNLMHGNRVNRETTTRWSMNCRFKSLFSPYADKRLGEFFEPVTLKPATRLGAAYTLPGGFGG